MQSLMRLIPYTRRYGPLVMLGWICTIVSGVLVMASPWLVRVALNQGLRPLYEGEKVVGLGGNANLLIYAALAVIAVAVGRGLTQFEIGRAHV